MIKQAKKGDVESICARVTKYKSKKGAKVAVNLNWLWKIDYGLFWLYIYIHRWFRIFDTNVFFGFIVSLFIAAPGPTVWQAWNLIRYE